MLFWVVSVLFKCVISVIPTGYVFPECVLISSTETNQTQWWEWRSSKPTVESAVFLIVSASECKGVISGLVKQPPGGCFKRKCLACDDCSAQLGLCCRFRSKFSDALKTAGEAGFLQILCRDLWVSLGRVCIWECMWCTCMCMYEQTAIIAPH